MDHFTTSDFAAMQSYFLNEGVFNYALRKERLQTLRRAIQKYERKLIDSLYKDLRKAAEEAFATEIGFIYAEISHALKRLASWMEPRSVNTPLAFFPSQSRIIRDPLGVCLIIGPWNYPFQLTIAPLIGAITGGNCIILKPSELSENTSEVIREMITEFFDKKFITVITGDGASIVPQIMKENRFDHVFFTGSIPVGREIAMLAAQKLTPVTLELGGKSPCIVDENVDLKVAARRITWGKFVNAGQTCVSPDYLLVHEKNRNAMIDEIQKNIHHFYGDNPETSPDYGRIINKKRFEKLESYLTEGRVVAGGQVNKNDLYISPTIMDDVPIDAPVMREEIFGPILPVITYNDVAEALKIISANPYPLSLYYFGNNKKNERIFIENVQFGGGCINNALVHLGNPDLPFGGVGNSGVGVYHGKFGFETFTRTKAILKTATWIDPAIKYPPYRGKLKILRWFFK